MCLKRNVKKKIMNHVRNEIWKKSMWKNKGLFRYGIVATDTNAGYLLWFKVPT